jgi:glycosyltransferase involved in cell wall biosynthesis
MDDVVEFPDVKLDLRKIARTIELEKRLVSRADLVFASSNHLNSKLLDRYQFENGVVVNNAVDISIKKNKIENRFPENEMKKILGAAYFAPGKRIVYIGTISAWLDVRLINESLDRDENHSYILIGPCEIPLISRDRLFLVPPINHRFVDSVMRWADVLVMPFILTELVRSVNPVKVYEFINANTPAIVLGYSETLKFAPYVYLYQNSDDYLKLIQRSVNNDLKAKVPSEVAAEFINANTWDARVEKMIPLILEKLEKRHSRNR